MIHLKDSCLKVSVASRAVALLLTVERLFVSVVWRQLAEVRAFGNVGMVRAAIEQPKLGRLLADVDADPLTTKLFGRNAGCRAAAEGIRHHVAFVGNSLDDVVEQRKGFLGRVASAFLGIVAKRTNTYPYRVPTAARVSPRPGALAVG
ncbi:MAG: hypothetical protein OXH72_02455 [Caldilineaceae bacterium]|nr:hypothetical protein [Caldilineaceae bacterium]